MQAGKTVIVTGSNSGIGRATAELFAARGWQVIATMRRMELADIFKDKPNIEVVALDVANPASIEAFKTLILDSGRSVDVLVNNAGYLQLGPLEASSMEQVREQFETNVFGAIGLTKAFLPHFRDRKAGAIINVSSMSAENGYPFASVYSATKAALATLTEALNIELEPIGVRAKAVLPGMHKTRIFDRLDPARDVPAIYRPLFSSFNKLLGSLKGSSPEVAADVIYRAATDNRASRVRYYSGPDAKLVPTAKRLMGLGGYWSFFRRTMLKGPNPVVQKLSPQGKLDMRIDLDTTLGFKSR
jgi:NAD(P)-dependent dehydrogenase (short-subunit alcohol dehydrogenase family)